MTKTIWLHGIKYGCIFLKEIEVVKETPRLYTIKDCSESGWRSQIPKDDKGVSSCKSEAVTRLIAEAESAVAKARQLLNVANDNLKIAQGFSK
jgi:hypothetical protein